ncbi:FxsA family protein [Corynebacterium testudinoris]|uniref:Protein affecting phage T7 exclusion by the F plasmid n=1 Tax=Corynebacterium testudinoris TaxID=136857 RepID=A0A0G3HA26_9CORY|nr:FxsA family protein [Corynebacterium testudinoris]AKK08748.1 protein affecting phage T7 exclusion by the F plasmid [Corynebacterium testudinoris]MBX8994832.1 FxsA family protein [Corynebacterium testudinoris]
MPFLLAVIPYLVIEALAFWAVASWIGVGWAILTVFALMAISLILAGVEMRRVSRAAAAQKIGPGRLAGDYGLLTAGAILGGIPGIVSSILGLLLIFAPTRGLIRQVLAVKLVKTVEDLGVRSFEATNAGRAHTNYGSFGAGTVIDEEEIRGWTENIQPEDFGGDHQPKDDK